MTFDRKPNRLKHFDYSQPGYYFITICVQKMRNELGKISNGKMLLNINGNIVKKYLNNIQINFTNIEVDSFVIMPNHLHMIIIINPVGDANFASPTNSTDRTKMILSKIIQQFKRICTIEIKRKGNLEFRWQRSYYDRIIRNERELFNIRRYIQKNPLKWHLDEGIIENIDL